MRALRSLSRWSLGRFVSVPTGILALLAVTAWTGQPAPAPRESVASLGWLAGCWVEDLGAITIADEWDAPVDHTVLGVSRTRRGDSTVSLERRAITDTGGTLALTIMKAAGESRLRASRSTASTIEFVDAAHQTLLRLSRDSLGRLELTSERRIGGRERTLDELFARASCADGSGGETGDSLVVGARPAWRGAGFGIDMNSLANDVSAGLQLFVPASRSFAVVARPMLTGGASSRDLDLGGRVELQLHSPIYDNRVRVYLGVGPQGFYELRGEAAHSRDFSGGWDAGAEVFVSPRFGVHWEMGTSGGSVTSGAGPAFSVGFRAYPWT